MLILQKITILLLLQRCYGQNNENIIICHRDQHLDILLILHKAITLYYNMSQDKLVLNGV